MCGLQVQLHTKYLAWKIHSITRWIGKDWTAEITGKSYHTLISVLHYSLISFLKHFDVGCQIYRHYR